MTTDSTDDQKALQRVIRDERAQLTQDLHELSSMVRLRFDVAEQIRRHPQEVRGFLVGALITGLLFAMFRRRRPQYPQYAMARPELAAANAI